jgi:hypothetical protein
MFSHFFGWTAVIINNSNINEVHTGGGQFFSFSGGRCVGGMIVFCYSHSPTAASLRHRNLKERGGRASLSLSLFPLAHFAPVSISNSLYKKSHQQASDKYLWFQKCFYVLSLSFLGIA